MTELLLEDEVYARVGAAMEVYHVLGERICSRASINNSI
jgi:hypothetical protein